MKFRTLALACSGIALSLAASTQSMAQAQTDIPVAQQTQTGPVAPRRAVRAETPPPRDANGRAVLGSVPGNVGSWEGFGSRPMLRFLDVEYEGNIMAFTPLEQALGDSTNFPKIRESEIPYQPWAKALSLSAQAMRTDGLVLLSLAMVEKPWSAETMMSVSPSRPSCFSARRIWRRLSSELAIARSEVSPLMPGTTLPWLSP